MGFFSRFRGNTATFGGVSEADLGDDFEAVVGQLHETLLGQKFLVQEMGSVVVCRSPVLVWRDGKVLQPASVVPAPMLARFWSGEGRDVLEGTELAPVVARLAPHFAASDELTRVALADVHEIFVSDDAPTAMWPTQDRRLRLASLILTDVVRKLAFGFSDRELLASYGLSRSTEHDGAAQAHYQRMSDQETGWMKAALAGA